MTDIVERLWAYSELPTDPAHRQLIRDAADEIERLRKLDTYELGYAEGERSGQVNAELKYEEKIEQLQAENDRLSARLLQLNSPPVKVHTNPPRVDE